MSTWRGLKLVEKIGGYSWTPTEGLVVRPRYEGDKASVMKIAAQLRNAGIAHDVDIDGPVASVEAITPSLDSEVEVVDYWELVGQQESVDIRQHPAFHALTDAEKFVINQCLDGIEKPPPSGQWTFQINEDATPQTITPSETAKHFYYLAYNGQTTYFRTARVLRLTLLVNNQTQAAIASAGVDNIYTTQQVIDEANAAGYPVHPIIQSQMLALQPLGTVPTGYAFGWLKQSPSARTTNTARLEVSVEYILEMWSTVLYAQKS